MKTIFKTALIALCAVAFAAFFAACPEEPGNDGPGGHDIDKALYGTWENQGGSLTVIFSSENGIEWGGAVGNSYNSLPVDKWTANNGVISTTYAGDTYTVWNYTINYSGDLVLTSPTGPSTYTLVKKRYYYGDFEYDYTATTVTIIGYKGNGGAVEIPSTIDEKPVVAIKDGSSYFYGVFYNKNLTSVTIPNSVTTIGDGAFANNQLTSVTIGSGVTSIGREAFYSNKLTSVTIGNSVTSIGREAFSYNQLASVTIPNSVTTIMPGVFACNPMKSITIGANVNRTNVSLAWDFFDDFYTDYSNEGKQAGTYIFTGTITEEQGGNLVHTGSWSKN